MTTQGRTKGRPRKRQPKPGERVSLGLRVTPSVKSALDRSAEQSGRSQSQEAELRLEQSFRDQDILSEAMDLAYGREGAAILAMIGETIRAIGFWAPHIALMDKRRTDRWLDNPFLFDEIVGALNRIFIQLRPEGETSPPKPLADTLSAIGQRNARAMLTIIADPAVSGAALAKSGWAERIRARLGEPTLKRLLAPGGATISQQSSKDTTP